MTTLPVQDRFAANSFEYYPQASDLEELHIKCDMASGLVAIIAISDTQRGPAIGGCRCLPYDSFDAALNDAVRLARGMSYKAAINQLPCGGGKAVLLRPRFNFDPKAYFAAFGRFVNELNGRYVTSIDSGTHPEDLAIIAQETTYVTGLNTEYAQGNPAPYTALGVQHAIEAALHFKYGSPDVAGKHIAIQGIGQVGYHLAQNLAQAGAKLTVADVDSKAIERCRIELNANVVSPETIYQVECDVFAPCALGGILNETTIPQLRSSIIAGAANNQIADKAIIDELKQRDIIYAPDYIASSGGLIHAAYLYGQYAHSLAEQQISRIYHKLLTIFQEAKQLSSNPVAIADRMAMATL